LRSKSPLLSIEKHCVWSQFDDTFTYQEHSTRHGSMSRGKIFYPAPPHQNLSFIRFYHLILILNHKFASSRHITYSISDFLHDVLKDSRWSGTMIIWDGEMSWWSSGPRTGRRAFLPGRDIFDQMIWSTDLISWLLSHHITIQFFMHKRPDFGPHLLIWDDSYRQFLHQSVDFESSRSTIIQEMIYSSRDDFFHIYWFSRSPKDQWARRWVCGFDEIRSKWQQSSKTAWSEENNSVTTEDLDSQRDLDESWDWESVDEIVEREFLYNEMIFSSR
jgi:hypothetical protein